MNFLSIRSFRSAAAALALTLTFAAPAMHAQAQSPDLAIVNVPFAFEIGSAHFAAGEYTVVAPRFGVLQVRGASSSALLMGRKESENKPSAKSTAVFHKAGGKYFLAEIHTQGSENYIQCAKSNQEAWAIKTDQTLNPAKGSGVEVTTVETVR